jgi:quinolinate synthase
MVSSGVNFGLAGQLLQQGETIQADGASGTSWATQPIGAIGCPTGVKGVDLAEEIAELKRDRKAVILAHNYQVPELQDIADYVGDSLGLSYQAAKTDAEVILFCGVHFMAETAKIINPSKKVLLPDLDAGCSLSESCPPEKLKEYLDQHTDKNYYVVAYINCSAGVKALADVICTSSNAEKIVGSVPAGRNILFVPDQNLGAWVMERTGRKMDLWQGTCYVHVEFTARSINGIREQYPGAPVVAHPECTYAVRMLADEVCSTEKMVTFCKQSPAREIIVVTEAGMLHRLKKEIPDKLFIPGPTENCFCGECRFMKMNTLEKAHAALLQMEPEITLPEPLRKRAEAPIVRMLELSK